ncbi:hypothetical protein IMCC3317_42670 [Kordia antarctica]|uniref:Fibronectin type-III domain-containing protein n=1 Tax=Kordia antarctica TaxID=1218801 RepID=A0A7L4ZQV5_9FLAO|nr:YHYH protein [Kordia antarctica]QHI38867.1 hypothetical protein IMCC3317_42670 [Kordia antarctica]
MKNLFKITLAILVFASLLVACGSDDVASPDSATNNAPGSFTATITNVTETSANVNWSASTDADGDAVTYTVNLAGSEIASAVSQVTYALVGLTSGTNYSGTIVASDGNGGTTSTSFGFTTTAIVASLHNAFSEFDAANVTIMLNGSNVEIETNGMPNHTSPYWSNTTARSATDPMGNTLTTPASAQNHPLFVEPTATSYAMMAPGNIDDFNGSYSLTIPAIPTLASSSSATGLGAIGIAISGAMIYNDEEGPNVPLDNAVGSLDYTAAHTGPQSYHYHLETKAWSEDDEELIGIIADGFFLYGRKCNSTATYPTDLDASGGHTSTTQHTTTAEYHYHIQNELYLNEYYILFPGNYQGTANNIQ